MRIQIIQIIHSNKLRQLLDIRNIGLYIFALMVLSVSWSGVNSIQTNYDLQKKVSTLKQQNDVQQLENENMKLKNKFLETNQYLELSARQQFGKAAPGEKVYIVPKEVALSYLSPDVKIKTDLSDQNQSNTTKKSKITQNLLDWKDFLSGHSQTSPPQP